MTVPIFYGIGDDADDAYSWVLSMEKFLNVHCMSEATKVTAAVMALRGHALEWWLWWSHCHPEPSWDTFTTVLLWRFKSEWRHLLPVSDEEEEPTQELQQSLPASASKMESDFDSFTDPDSDFVEVPCNDTNAKFSQPPPSEKSLSRDLDSDSDSDFDFVDNSNSDSSAVKVDDITNRPPCFSQPPPLTWNFHRFSPSNLCIIGDNTQGCGHHWPLILLDGDATTVVTDVPVMDTGPFDPGPFESPPPAIELQQPRFFSAVWTNMSDSADALRFCGEPESLLAKPTPAEIPSPKPPDRIKTPTPQLVPPRLAPLVSQSMITCLAFYTKSNKILVDLDESSGVISTIHNYDFQIKLVGHSTNSPEIKWILDNASTNLKIVVCTRGGFVKVENDSAISFESKGAGLDFVWGLNIRNLSLDCWSPYWSSQPLLRRDIPLGVILPRSCVNNAGSYCDVYPNFVVLCHGSGSICIQCQIEFQTTVYFPWIGAQKFLRKILEKELHYLGFHKTHHNLLDLVAENLMSQLTMPGQLQLHDRSDNSLNVLVFHIIVEGNVVWSQVTKTLLREGLVSDNIESFIRADDATQILGKNHDLVKYLLRVRQKAKEPKVDNELICASAKIVSLTDIDEFIPMPNVANLQNALDWLYDETLYEAAKMMIAFLSNWAKLPITLVKLNQFQCAVDAEWEANNSKTWTIVFFRCVDGEEFRLAQICGLHIISQVNDLEEVRDYYQIRGYFNEIMSLPESGSRLERTLMGIFTELRVLYTKYHSEKLMEPIKLFTPHLNIPKLIKAGDAQQQWQDMTFLNIQYDELIGKVVNSAYKVHGIIPHDIAITSPCFEFYTAMLTTSSKKLTHSLWSPIYITFAPMDLYDMDDDLLAFTLFIIKGYASVWKFLMLCSADFRQWDPGGSSLCHWRAQLDFNSTWTNVTAFWKFLLITTLRTRLLWTNGVMIRTRGPSQVTNVPAFSNSATNDTIGPEVEIDLGLKDMSHVFYSFAFLSIAF